MYGLFLDKKLVAYLEILLSNGTAIVHSTMGHKKYLSCGIMKTLFMDVIKIKWGQIKYLVYGNRMEQTFFKKDLLIKEIDDGRVTLESLL